ncbi:18912_t:CDS:1 [Funneliformis geosporum]|nr:18912_t:CDS:1 [Funneliformis geosporum]
MQTTTFDPNYTIFNKRFIPEFVSDVCSLPIDLKPLEGDQFWPTQHKPQNMLKKIIKKTFRSLKRKKFHKNRKGKGTIMGNNTINSKLTCHTASTDKDTTEIDDIFDIYLSFQDSEESNSSNTTEDVACFSARNDCNTLEISTFPYEEQYLLLWIKNFD